MYPFAVVAGLLAVLFLVTALDRSRPARLLAGLLWAAYAIYEYHVANGTLCGPDCNIRVDLAIFLPLLAAATHLGLRRAPRRGAVVGLCVACLGLAALLATVFGFVKTGAVAGVAALVAVVVGIRGLLTRAPPTGHTHPPA